MDDQLQEQTTDEVPARSPKGLEILQYAFQQGECILEFGTTKDSGLTVMDVTEHHSELQEHYDQNAKRNRTDNETTGSS